MVHAQIQGHFQTWSCAPFILYIPTDPINSDGNRRGRCEILLQLGARRTSGIEGADIERNQQPDGAVAEIVVSDVVAVEVFTQLQGVFGAQSVGEIIHELILGDVTASREIEVYAAQSGPI